jgi:tetratricopeptide (TPR) repeat protein
VLSSLGYIASQRGQNEEAERFLRRAIELDPKSYPPYHDLGRLLVKTRRYDEALPILTRGAALNTTDAGVHYQLFLAYSRLKKKDEADRELAEFKRLEEGNKHSATPLGDGVKSAAGMAVEVTPPLPSSASGETKEPRTPNN